jgi:hypothetical protein
LKQQRIQKVILPINGGHAVKRAKYATDVHHEKAEIIPETAFTGIQA